MKQLLTSFLLSFYFVSGCQNLPSTNATNAYYDNLSKYSYFVYAKRQNSNSVNAKKGTCFFIKHAGKTFIVSAKHVFTIWQGDSTISQNRHDTFYIRIPNNTSDNFDFIPVDVSEFNNKVQPSYYYKSPDIILVELKKSRQL